MSHNFDGDRISLGGNINSHWSFQQQLEYRRRLQRERRASSTIGVTRGGPGGYGNNAIQLALSEHRRPQAGAVRPRFNFGTDGHGDSWGRGPERHVQADRGALRRIRYLAESQYRGCAVDRRRSSRMTGPATSSAARSDDHVDDDTRQLHDDAQSVGAGLRAAVRIGGRLRELPRARRRAGRALREPVRAVCLRRQPGLHASCRSARPTSCVGSTSPARRSLSSGSKAGKTSFRTAPSASAAITETSSPRRQPTPCS